MPTARSARSGIGSAGPIDAAAGTVSPINIVTWHDFPLRDRVAAAVPDVPVALAGDAICMALGEHWRGAGRGVDFMLGMVVSTGVGGGLVLDGVPYHGRTGNAGHVGHVVVEPDGQPVPLRRPRMRRDGRSRPMDDAVGVGQRLGRAAGRRRRGTGRRGRRR